MVRFGPVAIDPDSREIRLNGEIQHLEPQACDVLAYLIENRHRLLPKTELLDEIWGDQFVSESALTTRIKEIRQAVGDNGKAQGVIGNTRGRGDRFVAVLDEADTRANQLHLAAAAAADRRDGAFFVDLAAITGADDVLPALRQAVGFASLDTSDGPTIEALSGLDAVVVLDNCEHLVAAVADLVQRIVTFRGPVSILATSRERLGVPGERRYPVEPLDADSARALFLERARATRPDFVVEDDHESLDRLLTALDRLPLAIEMAAGRLSAMSLGDLSRLLGEELGALRSPHRHSAERHRTLTDLVEWSEQLLSPADRRLLADLSVFAGPATLGDILGVLGETGIKRLEIIDGLTALVDRSLVSADVTSDPANYRMLETVKAHTQSRGDDLPRRRHAQWYVGAADEADRQLRTPGERSGHDWFTRAKPELRAAHLWARDHDAELACRLVAATALFAHSRLQDLGTDHGDMPAAVHGLIGRMLAYTYRRQPDAAVQLLDEAPDRRELAPTDRAWLEYAAAEAMVETAPDDAIIRYEQAIELAEPVGNRFVTSVSRVSLAASLARHGRPEDAIERFRSALAAFRRDGNLTHAATTLRNLVVFLVRVGADEPAMVLLGVLSGDEIKATYGREEERLQSCRAMVERLPGAKGVERRIQVGTGHRMSWALAHSIDTLDALVSTGRVEVGIGPDGDA